MLIGNTEFVHPEDDSDVVDVKIVLAAPKLTPAFEKDFGSHGANFAANVRNYLSQFERKVFLEKAKTGSVTFTLNGIPVTLKHKVHFFVDAREMLAQK